MLTINNEKIEERKIFGEEMMADIGQIDMKERTRRYGQEEAERMMGEMMKNNEEIIRIQKQLEGLIIEMEKKKQWENREMERRRDKEQEETDR